MNKITVVVPKLKDSPDDIKKIKKLLTNIISIEFSNMLKPCYLLKLIKYWGDLKNCVGIDERDIKLFFKLLPTPYIAAFRIANNPITALFTISILYYCRIQQYEVARLFYYLLAIRFYGNISHKHWGKYCKNEVWETALSKVSQKHLFKQKQGIPNAVLYLANIEFEKNKEKLTNEHITDLTIMGMLYVLRHRVAQSTRSFAQKYYKLDAEGGNKETSVVGDEEASNVTVIAEKISNSICSYSQIDKLALAKAVSLTGIRRDLCYDIIKDISLVEHKTQLKFILLLFLRSVNIKDLCIESKRIGLVNKISQNSLKFGKYSIRDEIYNMTKSSENYFRISTVNKNLVAEFIANYLTCFVKNRYC